VTLMGLPVRVARGAGPLEASKERPREGAGTSGSDRDSQNHRTLRNWRVAETFARMLSTLGTWKLHGENSATQLYPDRRPYRG
jgi:hypothetical protein